MTLPQVMGQQLAIPEVLLITQIARMQAQIPLQCRPNLVAQSSRPTLPFPLTQAGEATLLKAMHPTLDGGGMLAEPVGDVIAAMALPHEQDAVQSVVVAGFIGATNLLLERDSHGFRILNMKCFHAQSLRSFHPDNQAIYTALFMTLCIAAAAAAQAAMPI
jgi:hypothetical protein